MSPSNPSSDAVIARAAIVTGLFSLGIGLVMGASIGALAMTKSFSEQERIKADLLKGDTQRILNIATTDLCRAQFRKVAADRKIDLTGIDPKGVVVFGQSFAPIDDTGDLIKKWHTVDRKCTAYVGDFSNKINWSPLKI